MAPEEIDVADEVIDQDDARSDATSAPADDDAEIDEAGPFTATNDSEPTVRNPVVPSPRASRTAQRQRTWTAIVLIVVAIIFVAVVWFLGERSEESGVADRSAVAKVAARGSDATSGLPVPAGF